MSKHVTDRKFQENLKVGIFAEDKVYSYLQRNYSYVQDMRYQKHENGVGPRLRGMGGSIILPDFAFYDRYKGSGLIDVKYKTSSFFTVDDYKYRDYLECLNIMNLDTLMLVFVYNNQMYFYDSTDRGELKTFNNDYGKAAYVFKYDRSKIRK